MNYKALYKALRFICLPTLAVFCLIVFVFCDFKVAKDFIFSSKGEAMFIRFVLFCAEVGLVIYFYFNYAKELRIEEEHNKELQKKKEAQAQALAEKAKLDAIIAAYNGKLEKNTRDTRTSTLFEDYHGNLTYDSNFDIYGTDDPYVKVVKCIPSNRRR